MKSLPTELEFFTPDQETSVFLDFYTEGVQAGVPAPASDGSIQNAMSLDNTVVRNKETTFYARVVGQSMINAGLHEGDILVVDKSIAPQHNQIAVCVIDGEFTVKRLHITEEGLYLMPENENYQPIKIEEFHDFRVWGVVTYVVKRMA